MHLETAMGQCEVQTRKTVEGSSGPGETLVKCRIHGLYSKTPEHPADIPNVLSTTSSDHVNFCSFWVNFPIVGIFGSTLKEN